MMRFDGYNETEQAQFDRTAQLVHLRRSTMPLLYGDMLTLHLSSDVWVFVRVYMGEWTLVALNTGYEARTVEVTLPATLDAAQPLQAQFGNAFEQQENRVTLTLPACEFEILTKK
jgi:glycosidase